MVDSDFSTLIRGTAKSSLILILGQIISNIIVTLTIIWIARTIGPTNYGEYTLAILPVSIAFIFQDLGMNTALMRFCAKYRYEGQIKELKKTVITGLLFSIFTSLIISSFIYVFSGPISTILLQRPELEHLVRATALSVLGYGGLLTTVSAIFVGYEMMGLRGLTQIVYSLIRGAAVIILVLVGYGTMGTVLSYTLALLASGLISVFLLFKYIKFNDNETNWLDLQTLKTLLTYGIPLSLGAIVGGILTQFYSTIMAMNVETTLIGNYSAAVNFGVIITFITIPVANSIFPLFSKFKREDPKLKTTYRLAVKYTSMLTLPLTLVIIALSAPLTRLIYGTDYPNAASYLSLYMVIFLFEGMGGAALSNLITSTGETGVSLRTSLLQTISGIAIALILVPKYQITGLLITMIIAPRIGWVYQTIWVQKHLGITVEWKSTITIYIVGAIAFGAIYLLIPHFSLHGWVAIVTGGVVYFTVYGVGLPLFKILKKGDIQEIYAISETLGPFSMMLKKILSIYALLIKD
jgi:stage V sporulation protein B